MTNDPGSMSISYAALSGAEQELGQAYQAARSAIDELKAKLNQNLAEWTGEARTAYEQVQREWDQAFAHMATVLQQAQRHLGDAHEMFQTVERNNTSIWGNKG